MGRGRYMDRIAQGPPKSFERNLHYVSILQGDTSPETQAVRSKEVDVNVARPAMSLELEMMMLEVPQTVTHFRFAGSEGSGPDRASSSLDIHLHSQRREFRVDNNLRSQSARSEL